MPLASTTWPLASTLHQAENEHDAASEEGMPAASESQQPTRVTDVVVA